MDSRFTRVLNLAVRSGVHHTECYVARHRLDIPQQEWGRIFGVGHITISRWERRVSRVPRILQEVFKAIIRANDDDIARAKEALREYDTIRALAWAIRGETDR